VDRYCGELEGRFAELFPDARSIVPFSGYARDPAEWRFEPSDVLRWLEPRARPDVRFTVWSQRKGAIFTKKVTEGVYGAWKVHEGVVHSGQDYSSRMWSYIDFAMTTGRS